MPLNLNNNYYVKRKMLKHLPIKKEGYLMYFYL